MPGYWAWDPQREDFLWVSGLWRDIPPGRNWVPGEWVQAENGFQWTPGFWAGEAEIRYLPTPPATIEEGPSSPAPGYGYLWAPGCWRRMGNPLPGERAIGTVRIPIGFGRPITMIYTPRVVC
ncbi:MAG: hypothetical protein CMJ72_03750 [Planctomycetaceae bacterium]|nr:hypothetical protein [Planctomycetaceae bacterium]